MNAQKIFERYSKFTPLELRAENEQLIRNYMHNYQETKKLVPYMIGRYVITDTADLSSKDMFPSGVVALAQAAEFPQVLIEHVYPASPKMVPSLHASLQTGSPIKLERTNDLAAVIHIERTSSGRMQFTVVPLLYGSYGGATAFSLEPPSALNMEPGLPVIKKEKMEEGLKKYADYRVKHPLITAEGEPAAQTGTGAQEIVRVDVVEPGKPVPDSGPMPALAVVTPIPMPGGRTPYPQVASNRTPLPSTPRYTALATPTPPLQMTRLNTPAPVPAITPLPANAPGPIASNNYGRPTPMVAPPPTGGNVPEGVIKPFFDRGVSAQRDPNMPNAGASWKTYAPGSAPPARAVSLDEVGPIADRGDVGERLYLRGEFRVTASGSNRAVLRDATKPDDQSPRVVVEYPAGSVPPAERDRFVRDNSRPYLISDVRRGADGVVTIYVKEIISQ
jgi:hypothetical protein